MKSTLITQVCFTFIVCVAMGYVTYCEWKKIGWLDDVESAQQIDAYAQRVKNFPDNVPNWRFVENTKIDTDQKYQINQAKITQFVSRVYQNKETGEQVSVFLSTGPSSDISVHTPEQCYGGQSEKLDHEPIEYKLFEETDAKANSDEKREVASFIHQRYKFTNGQVQDVWWTFNQDGKWIGSKDPRRDFLKPALYKVYLFSLSQPSEHEKYPVQVRFMKDFMTVSDPVLFPAKKTTNPEPKSDAPTTEQAKTVK